MPLGSSSKLGPLKDNAESLDFTDWIESPDSNRRPPSIDFNSSCVSEGFASVADVVPAYASYLPSQCETKSA